jgi:uncharacterized protein (TIGR02301 family)
MLRLFTLRTAIVGLAMLAVAPAAAQAPVAGPQRAPIAPPTQVVPYDAALLRLAEIMGSLHFLRQLCDGEGSSSWRDQMTALLDAEQPDDQRRARLVDRFNRGFEAFRSVYRGCTDSARLTITRYQDEGSVLAAEIGARYGRSG